MLPTLYKNSQLRPKPAPFGELTDFDKSAIQHIVRSHGNIVVFRLAHRRCCDLEGLHPKKYRKVILLTPIIQRMDCRHDNLGFKKSLSDPTFEVTYQ